MMISVVANEESAKEFIAFIASGGTKFNLGNLIRRYRDKPGIYLVSLTEAFDRLEDTCCILTDLIKIRSISTHHVTSQELREEIKQFNYSGEPVFVYVCKGYSFVGTKSRYEEAGAAR